MRTKRFLALIATMLTISLPLVAFWQRMAIYDWVRLRGYEPSTAVVQLATDTTMNDKTRRLFYVYRPGIEDKKTFYKSCVNKEQTVVLGCYIDRERIHLLNVTDSRLAGVEEVTAAHEVLHAAYARLSEYEREDIDSMTASFFSTLTDERIKETIEQYRKQDPNIVPNELHSILGTEVRNLSDPLEDYYKKYFTDRSKIVGFSEQYEQAFTDRKDQIVAYNVQLASLKQQIEFLQAAIDKTAVSLDAQRTQLDSQRTSGNIEAYNSGVPGYNNNIAKYNQQIDQLTVLVSSYNDIIPKLNAIAGEVQDLVKAIDSRETVPARQ